MSGGLFRAHRVEHVAEESRALFFGCFHARAAAGAADHLIRSGCGVMMMVMVLVMLLFCGVRIGRKRERAEKRNQESNVAH